MGFQSQGLSCSGGGPASGVPLLLMGAVGLQGSRAESVRGSRKGSVPGSELRGPLAITGALIAAPPACLPGQLCGGSRQPWYTSRS